MPDPIEQAAAHLRSGGLVAFPTETVYGLGADALSEAAVKRVFEAKGRPAANPLIVHVTGLEMAATLTAGPLTESAAALMRAFWPGPLSIVLPKHARIPSIVTGGGSSVALRCPDHPVALALLFAFGGPLVGPSANKSGGVSPTTADHVRGAFDPALVTVLDGGPCQVGLESTVISLHDTGAAEGATILRPGVIGAAQLESVLNMPVGHGPAVAGAGPLPSPGMLASHYAPRARTVLFSDWRELHALAEEAPRLVVLSHSVMAEESDLPPPSVRAGGAPATLLRLPPRAADYAAALYSTLRRADDLHAPPPPTLIAVHRPPLPEPADTGEEAAVWRAVHDRLARAAAPRGEGDRSAGR